MFFVFAGLCRQEVEEACPDRQDLRPARREALGRRDADGQAEGVRQDHPDGRTRLGRRQVCPCWLRHQQASGELRKCFTLCSVG